MADVLAKGVPFRFRAVGYSMSPFIRNGDVITVRPCKRTDLRKGAVVAYIRPLDGHLAVHRLVGGTGAGFALKGDHEPISDFPVAASGIMGVVDRVERNGRRVRLGLGPGRRLVASLSAWGFITWAFRAFGRKKGLPGQGPVS
jgi:signal peptidase I